MDIINAFPFYLAINFSILAFYIKPEDNEFMDILVILFGLILLPYLVLFRKVTYHSLSFSYGLVSLMLAILGILGLFIRGSI